MSRVHIKLNTNNTPNMYTSFGNGIWGCYCRGRRSASELGERGGRKRLLGGFKSILLLGRFTAAILLRGIQIDPPPTGKGYG